MSVQSWWCVDNFKLPSLVGGKLGSNNYYGENLALLLALQLQAKFKLEAIFENEKVFGKRKLCLD
jgi:hypothetical protein